MRTEVVTGQQIPGQRWQRQFGEHLAVHHQLQHAHRTVQSAQSTSSGCACLGMVSVAIERTGNGWRNGRSLHKILERKQRHGHQFDRLEVAGVRTAVVQELQGIDLGPRLRQQSADHLEVSVDGETGRTDRPYVARATNCNVTGWQYGDQCSRRRNVAAVELFHTGSESGEKGEDGHVDQDNGWSEAGHTVEEWEPGESERMERWSFQCLTENKKFIFGFYSKPFQVCHFNKILFFNKNKKIEKFNRVVGLFVFFFFPS